MAGFIEADATQVRQLEADLSRAPFRVQWNASKATRNSARIVDAAMQVDASGHRYLPKLPAAVSHEMLGPLLAEIGLGPDGGQGSIAHIIVYGSVNNAPVYDHTAGLRRSMPAILEMYANAGEESVLGGTD